MSLESSYPTVGSDQCNAFYFPIKEAGAEWVALAAIADQFAQAQMDRLQNIGIGAYDLSIRKRHEIGRTDAMQKVSPSTVDKPVTLEWLEYGSMRVWNNFCGKPYDNTGDITQDDFDATLSEGLLIVHRLDEAKANVIGSDVLIRTVIENDGMSIPATEDDDLHCSVRLVGDEYFQTSNDAAMAVAFFDVCAGSVWTAEIAYNSIVERDDWPDNDDGANARTVLTANPGAAATVLTVNDSSNFSDGDIVVIETTAILWETTKIVTVDSATQITVQDGVNVGVDVGSQIRRTRGFFLKVHNNDGSGYLEHCTDYRVEKTDANTLTIINVDGGSELGITDNMWAVWCVNSGSELWTDNDSDVYGITHPMCTLEVSPEATFNSSTIGYDGVAVTEDTELDFANSGADVINEWYAYKFTTPGGRVGKIDYVEFNLSITGAGGGGWVTCSIYSDNAGMPADAGEMGNPSEPVLISAITAAGTMDKFSFTNGPSLAAATTYHAVLKTHGYTYNDGVTDLMWNVDATGGAVDVVSTGDPDATPIFTAVNPMDENAAEVNVALIASQWVRRLQGMDISNSYSRKRVDEMGTSIPVERPFDETEVRITLPKSASDETTMARLTQKNIATVKTMRPEQNPEVFVRLKVYSTEAKADDDLLLSYEFPQVQRTGGERSIPVNDNVQERITLTGDQRTIATVL